jgi:glutamine synthetase
MDGSACQLASREVLRTTLDGLRAIGFSSLAAFEYEVRIFDASGTPVSRGISYSLTEVLTFERLVAALEPALTGLGVELTAVHTEAGPGLLELNIAPREGLRAADDAAMLKMAVKDVAASLGLRASFLAKTAQGEEGSSGHVHLSCWQNGQNAFALGMPDETPSGPLAGALAGIIEHLPAASLLLNPTINSYKRLVPGYFAPVNASWGRENRSAAVRLIWSEQPGRCRLECRRPGADANPYLALAALVASAAEGIATRATPPPPVHGDASSRLDLRALPSSLDEAIRAFQGDRALRSRLGEDFAAYYEISRNWELKAWQQTVTDWERARYGEVV